MRRRDSLLWCLVAVVFSTVGIAPGHSGEPQATFVLKGGWVDVTVRQDRKPVGGVRIQVLNEHGVKFAEGEAGAGGETTFPMPPGAYCIVEIKTGEKTADSIRLFKTESGVEPARVLLSYGLRPCCRSKLIKPEPIIAGYPMDPPAEPDDSTYLWTGIVAMLGGIGIMAAQVWWLRRRYKQYSSHNQQQESS